MRLTGATVESTLDGIRAGTELYPHTSKKVPDVNFYYRYPSAFFFFFSIFFAVCQWQTDSVLTLSCLSPHWSQTWSIMSFTVCVGATVRLCFSSLVVLVLVRSLQVTSSCESGRSVVLTLRCDPQRSSKGELSVPRYLSLCPPLLGRFSLSCSGTLCRSDNVCVSQSVSSRNM